MIGGGCPVVDQGVTVRMTIASLANVEDHSMLGVYKIIDSHQ